MLSKFTNTVLNLELLAEESAEVAHIKSKIIRFGLEDRHPAGGATNRERLETECGHFMAMMEILIAQDIITFKGILRAKRLKHANLEKWYNKTPKEGHSYGPRKSLPDGVPCPHPGCLQHLTHPCEGCGRVGGVS